MVLSLTITSGCSGAGAAKPAKDWDPKAAATYLDHRQSEWAAWPGAARDHGTFCVSCHTGLPYGLARPVLSKALSETNGSAQETQFFQNVVRRVRLWDQTGHYYSDKEVGVYKTAESRGTEAILNALILVTHDAPGGRLSPDTRVAFDHMWALQEATGGMRGSWPWLRFGHEEPWEADDSRYYGACLAAIAVGKAPEDYRADSNVEQKIGLLRSYLAREYSQQSLINRVNLLWASTELPGLIEPKRQKALVEEVFSEQQADGGWQLAPLVWKWRGWTLASLGSRWLLSDRSFAERRSDGYATALMALVLPAAGVSTQDPRLQKAMSWLRSNQTEQGYWPAYSVNKRRNPTSNAGRFMSDAATAYAVLALTHGGLDNRRVAARNDVHSSTGKQLSY